MKLTKDFIAVLALLLCVSTSCKAQSYYTGNKGKKIVGSDSYVTKEMRMGGFTGVHTVGMWNVDITQKEGKPKVIVQTSDNLIDVLDIQVKDGELTLGFKKGFSVTYRPINVHIYTPILNSIRTTGGGNIQLTHGIDTDGDFSVSATGSGNLGGKGIKCQRLKADIAGSGNIDLTDVTCESFKTSIAGSGNMEVKGIASQEGKANIAGSGNMVLKGTCDNLKLNIAGSGELYADELEAKNVNASIAGSGNIRCFATGILKTNIAGSGDIGYKGNPTLSPKPRGVHKL